jgi:endonuclease/exonuclease/phosphatase family metal-dependent hydrolase
MRTALGFAGWPSRRLRQCRPTVERLEARELLSADIRVATYNIEDDINGATTPRSGLYQVLEGIGEEQLRGHAQPLDILLLQETTSNSTTVAPIVSNLNSYYNGQAVYAQSPYQATQDGSNADGNGPNALVYNTTTLDLLASVGVGTPEGSGNGEYRQVVRYEFQPVGAAGSSDIFYVYVSHMKSGTTSADATDRGEEATIIRNNEATLPSTASVLYTGDLNSAPPEAEFTNFTAAGQGEAYDPVNFSTSVAYYSESTTDLRYRDDYELMTSNVLNDTGAINYVSGTLHAFGNNGTTPSGGSVNSGSDTALNNDLVQDGPTFIPASTLYADLTTASDHLPVVADYTLAQAATTTSLASSANPSNLGQSVTFTATVSSAAGGTPTGTVTFLDGTTTLATESLSGGVATFTTSSLAAGTHPITAAYGGATFYSTSTSGALSQVVNANAAGVLGFSAANYTTAQGQADATLTVTRTSGTTGSVAVEYYTTDGTATSPADYTGVPASSPATLTFASGQSSAVIQIPIVDGGSNVANATFGVTLENPSGGAALGGTTAATVTIQDPTLQVTSLAPFPSGVVINFNRGFQAGLLNLYDDANGDLGPADVTLTGASTGPVEGSLLVGPGDQLTFIKTGGPLAADTYSVVVRSAANGLVSLGGTLLDGNGDGTPGDNYTSSFTVSSSSAPVVSIPDFTRGDGQPVNVPATGSGLPLTISNGSGVTAVTLDLAYNPALLSITGAAVGAGVPAGASVTLTTPTPGVAQLVFSSPTALPAGAVSFVSLTAAVPATAPYLAKELLQINNLSVNGGALAAVADDGVHVAAYLGDATGDGSYSSQDALLILRVSSGVDGGFTAYPLADPVLVGDVSGFGAVNSQDALDVLKASVGLSVPAIPAIPAGITPQTGGPDPVLFLPRLTVRPGQTLPLPVEIDVTAPQGVWLESADLAFSFDPTQVAVSNARTAGTLLDGFTVSANIDAAAGTVRLALVSPVPRFLPAGALGSLVVLDLTVLPGARGVTPLNLDANIGSTRTELNGGGLTLVPAPTNAADDPVDGAVEVRGPAPARAAPTALRPGPVGGANPWAGVLAPARPAAETNQASQTRRAGDSVVPVWWALPATTGPLQARRDDNPWAAWLVPSPSGPEAGPVAPPDPLAAGALS